MFLSAAKSRGVKLGNPNGACALRGTQVGNKEAVAAVKANAECRAANVRAIVDDLRAQGSPVCELLLLNLMSGASLRHAVGHGIQRQRRGYCRGCKRRAEREARMAAIG